MQSQNLPDFRSLFELQDVSDADLAFPANVRHLMPKYEDIPAEFKRHDGTKWNKLFNKWFYGGLKGVTFDKKAGVDDATANRLMRQVRCVIGSYEPKHEHKEAAVACMLAAYFEDYAS